ncbi:hypothetical protein Hypma_002220 [Hypsizygus marmoreus]|uniref:Uncharacterized protein n=1 Tax=Hypsizygus marmoreus TaxID=39966 RepID=A0A369K8E5_HYPMA|nr:hypothetical protein Hypma_002220 [Hypsizygus marmoreus]
MPPMPVLIDAMSTSLFHPPRLPPTDDRAFTARQDSNPFSNKNNDEANDIDRNQKRAKNSKKLYVVTTSPMSARENPTSSSGSPPCSPASGSQNFGCFSCVVQDNDARLSYRGAWLLSGSPSSTTHSTTDRGATVSFQFNGSGIVVFGTVPQSNGTVKPPSASYILDADPPFVTTQPTANQDIPYQPLFLAGQLSGKEHTLTIKIESDNMSSPYILERFFVFPRSNFTQHVVDALPTPTPVPSSAPSSLPKSPAITTEISTTVTVRVLAGTLGSLIAVVIIASAFFLYRWRHRITQWSSIGSSSNAKSSSSSSRGLQGTIFTSTESILRNPPSCLWTPRTRSEEGRSVVDYCLSLSTSAMPHQPIVRIPTPPPPGLPSK